MTTIQFDFNLPERFDMTYVGSDGNRHRPYMVHRALLGSLERFFGVLVEHYGGAMPVWLSPIQARVMPISDKQADYAREINKQLRAAGVRSELDDRSDKIGYRIRQAQLEKVPFMIILGDQEIENSTITVRLRNGENLNQVKLEDFVKEQEWKKL